MELGITEALPSLGEPLMSDTTSANAIILVVIGTNTDMFIPKQLSCQCRATKINRDTKFYVVGRVQYPFLEQRAITKVCFDNTDFFDARCI